LLSYVAAATIQIKLAPNVLNLPLRQPAVVARSAASLDLLSGGRLELALGAGAFWEAIEAMGGTRLTPGALALEQGLSTFILGSDNPAMLTQFAEEVVPAVREAVAADRASRHPGPGGRLVWC
jgi:hypothetical protein